MSPNESGLRPSDHFGLAVSVEMGAEDAAPNSSATESVSGADSSELVSQIDEEMAQIQQRLRAVEVATQETKQ